jgi:hypothetical protein
MAQRLFTCGVAVLILGAASVSVADPITVTGGSAGFDFGDPPGLHLIFDDAEFFGGFPLGGMTLTLPANTPSNCGSGGLPVCQPGGAVNLAAEWKQQSTLPGVATIQGQEFRPFFDLSLSFQAGDALLPPLTEHVEVTVPFTMVGTIALFGDQARTTPLLSDTITGQGTASADFVDSKGGWAFIGHQYLFEPATAPIPEPGTLTLLVTGAVGTVLLRKRVVSRRRRCGRDEALT